MNKSMKKFLIGVLIVLLLLIVGAVGMFFVMHRSITSNFVIEKDEANYYEPLKNQYPREEFTFPSGDVTLTGYLYGDPEAEKLLLFAHGLGDGHSYYIKHLTYFIDNGYQVMTYDGTGTGASEGDSAKGLVQSALDVESALAYIRETPALSAKPLYLMGHSWGAFGVCANANTPEVKAVCGISGYAYPVDVLLHMGSDMSGRDLEEWRILMNLSQKLTFGENAGWNAIDPINMAQVPILLVQGTDDDMIPMNEIATTHYKNQIKNPKLEYLMIDDAAYNGHMTVLDDPDLNPTIDAFFQNAK